MFLPLIFLPGNLPVTLQAPSFTGPCEPVEREWIESLAGTNGFYILCLQFFFPGNGLSFILSETSTQKIKGLILSTSN